MHIKFFGHKEQKNQLQVHENHMIIENENHMIMVLEIQVKITKGH